MALVLHMSVESGKAVRRDEQTSEPDHRGELIPFSGRECLTGTAGFAFDESKRRKISPIACGVAMVTGSQKRTAPIDTVVAIAELHSSRDGGAKHRAAIN